MQCITITMLKKIIIYILFCSMVIGLLGSNKSHAEDSGTTSGTVETVELAGNEKTAETMIETEITAASTATEESSTKEPTVEKATEKESVMAENQAKNGKKKEKKDMHPANICLIKNRRNRSRLQVPLLPKKQGSQFIILTADATLPLQKNGLRMHMCMRLILHSVITVDLEPLAARIHTAAKRRPHPLPSV